MSMFRRSAKPGRRRFSALSLRIIAFKNSFHGRTLGALAATGQDKYKDGFGPLPGVTHVPYGDAEAVRRAMGPDVAGILVEPIQGEGGVLPAPPGFLRELRDQHRARGIALRRFQYEGVSAGDGHRPHPEGDHRGEVERRDASGDAEGLELAP